MEKLGKYPEWALEIFFWVSILCGYYKKNIFFKNFSNQKLPYNRWNASTYLRRTLLGCFLCPSLLKTLTFHLTIKMTFFEVIRGEKVLKVLFMSVDDAIFLPLNLR